MTATTGATSKVAYDPSAQNKLQAGILTISVPANSPAFENPLEEPELPHAGDTWAVGCGPWSVGYDLIKCGLISSILSHHHGGILSGLA
jgi:hypothetical protein